MLEVESQEATDSDTESLGNAYLFVDLDAVLDSLNLAPVTTVEHEASVVRLAVREKRVDVLSALIEHGLEVNRFTERNSWTLLHMAAELGHEEVVEVLLKNKADVNVRTEDLHYCPMHVAVKGGHTGTVRLLMDAGSNVNAYANNGYSPLHLAAMEGHVEMVRLLLDQNIDVDMVSGHGNSALHVAIMECHYEVAKVLLEYGADVDAKNDSGWCPIHGAAEAGHVSFVDLLLQHKADIDALTTFVLYRTPLMLAANSGLTQVVATLLAHGAKPDIVTKHGETALHLAVLGRHLCVAKLLVQYKATIDVTTHLGLTPVHFAAKAQDVAMLTFLLESGASLDTEEKSQLCLGLAIDACDLTLVSLCIQRGAPPNIPLSVCGQTALHRAVRRGSKDLVRLLLELGANPNAMTEDCGETPLHVAAYGEAENEDLMKLLIRHGADVDAIFQQCRWTALTIVMENGHAGCTRLLLDNGADVCGMTDDGETALHIAAREGFTEGVELLLEQDAANTLCARDRDGDMPHHKTVYGDHQMALHVLLLHACPISTEDGSGETALEHAVTAKSFGCSVLLIIHGAVYDDVLLDFILLFEKEAMINMYEIFLYSGNTFDNPFQLLFANMSSLLPDQKVFRLKIRERVRNAISLKILSRMAIRNHFIDIVGNKSVVPAIKALPLPRVVREHLLLKEFSEFLETEVIEELYKM